MDKDIFTAKIAAWLGKTEHTVDDVPEGALLLLKLNRNRIMYNQILKFPKKYIGKLEYELQKFYKIRLDNKTIDDVKALDAELTPQIEAAIKTEDATSEGDEEETAEDDGQPSAVGKRTDHDSLPEDIQTIWGKNAERWKRIKEKFEECKTYKLSCDRYEHLAILKKLWYDYKADFERYDTYKLEDEQSVADTDPAEMHKVIGNARAYISKKLDSLLELAEAAKAPEADEKTIEKYHTLHGEIQNRVRTLVTYKQVISDKVLEKLEQADIYIATEDNGSGEESIDDTEAAE